MLLEVFGSLPDAQHGHKAVLYRCSDLRGKFLIGLVVERAPLGVADDHVSAIERLEEGNEVDAVFGLRKN